MSLNEKAINIKGKQYVLVSDRIIYFNESYPNGSITTKLLSLPTDERVVVQATVTPDGQRLFTGLSQAVVGDGYINKTSALENCETSAVGRALAMMGIGVIDSVASVDEIKKTTYPQEVNGKIEVEDTVADQKRKITMLMSKKMDNLKTKEDYEKACKVITGLELTEKNFSQIILKLK